ncbi:uncharacterized protein LOC106504840 [Sus scrofa]|uniref:uncharacterized protein LOC106504840 n=1 Tax=Sus scrofa TaxID=9823 RepID=UPI0006B189B7|nr:uncharacterized protein LOC106504840 [Sus scrofa]
MATEGEPSNPVRAASALRLQSPPAPSAAPLSPLKPSAALEVRWAAAGRDGQRVSPMAERRGQRGAGPCPGRVRPPPATSPHSMVPPSRPEAPRPASRLAFLPPCSRRSGARPGWSRGAPAGPACPHSSSALASPPQPARNDCLL